LPIFIPPSTVTLVETLEPAPVESTEERRIE
jgi:hypothetical protein